MAVEDPQILANATPYRQLIRSLPPSANMVRPDIAVAFDYLARFMHMPTEILWKACKRKFNVS